MNVSARHRYECTRCGNCCRWEGYVRVSDAEIDAIAEFLGMDADTFIEEYTCLTADRRSLTLVDQSNGACVMLTPQGLCRINPVKPRQCRLFPNEWNFPGFRSRCNAVDLGEAAEG
jgi:Fe-S-cluster containining protein